MISIIILNYNTFELTCSCIRSIFEQTKGVAFEIIVVDNASTETSPDKFKELFPDIVLIKNTENRGFSRGCNEGIKHANGDYILLLNSDTVLLNDAVSLTFDFLHHHSSVGIATCRLENKNGTIQGNCVRFLRMKWVILELTRVFKILSKKNRGHLLLGSFFSYNETIYPDWVWGTFFMFPRTLLKIFPDNKLPETFWMYVEDMEWCWLAHKAGYKVAFIPDGRVIHLGGGLSPITDIKKSMMSENFKNFYTIYYGKTYFSILLWLLNVLNKSNKIKNKITPNR